MKRNRAFGKRSDYALLRKATVVALAMFAICSGLLLLDFDFDPNLTVHDDLHTLSEHVNAVNRSRESNSQSTSAADNSTADNSGDSSASVPSPETSDTAESTGIHVMKLRAIEGERWYGGVVQRGYDMPFGGGSWRIDFGVTQYNQASPVLVSSAGRYIWAESPYTTVWSIGTRVSRELLVCLLCALPGDVANDAPAASTPMCCDELKILTTYLAVGKRCVAQLA
ncbi:hypothetical protein CYMTET_13305, partial [Cymbomonas tetramitiformis]